MDGESKRGLRRKDILTHATTWTNLEDMMLSEISQTQKDKYCMIHLDEVPGAVKFIETGNRMGVSEGPRERGEWGVIKNKQISEETKTHI